MVKYAMVASDTPREGLKATLILSDGTKYYGESFGAERSVAGEAVFQTGMVGYPESLTDPSYAGQLLCLTYPMIGNYGVPSEDEFDEHGIPVNFESSKVYPAALIVADLSKKYSHWNAKSSLHSYLAKHNVPGIHGVDTRALTKRLRETGSMLAKIVLGDESPDDTPFYDPNKINLVADVSTKEVKKFNPTGDVHIIAVDVGLKNNQLRCLISRGAAVTLVPWDYDFSHDACDGVFISNGPGDPAMAKKTCDHIKKLMQSKPETAIFGICLGHQLLSIACGATTYKLPYGNRGHNQPCRHEDTRKCFITSQNHGFATDVKSLPEDWLPLFTNANDDSNEGIVHTSRPWFSVQFHPEANAGPRDLECLFDVFLRQARSKGQTTTPDVNTREAITAEFKKFEAPCLAAGSEVLRPRKVLILGSGGLTIGQAGEFDYSGSQAIKALKEENIYTVLINPNIATVQTMKGLADKVYFVPVTPSFVEETIAEERPDCILLSFGGQTALNCGIELRKNGVFEKYNVRVLGTPVQAIEDTEDREIFAGKVQEIGESCVPSIACATVDEVIAAAAKVGYPIMMRSSFALGGLGSGVVTEPKELKEKATIAFSSTTQITIERSLRGWKEVEYEVVRDAYDNTITVCNMENFDPLGIHTGESIVVAPSQTLTDDEYNILRTCAVRVVRHIGIVGECNIQYALNPHSNEYYIIEVNARLSRSSALASKATGYPLAYVAAKLGLGHSLHDLRNSVTKKTTACFEPSLDYCVVKVPRWDLGKFPGVNRKLGTAMKSIGEVMAIGRTFEEAFQKSIRMLDIGADGFVPNNQPADDDLLENPTDKRFLSLATAFAEGYTVDRLYELTRIDKWFLQRLARISNYSATLKTQTLTTLTPKGLLVAKQLGFSDKTIADCLGSNELQVRIKRKEYKLRPHVKQIDTVAGEFPAQTNYLYLTYNATEDDITFNMGCTMVLGSGVYRIGSSVEFDYCAVGCVRELRRLGRETIMLNYNPETVSTDYDECSRMYFDQLTFETVMDIYDLENPTGVVLSMGGQIPNNIAMDLYRQKVRILGTSPDMIDGAENRFKFSRMCDNNNIDQPTWKELTSVDAAHEFCTQVTYPCLMRPSYILSGVGMRVVYNKADLEANFKEAAVVSRDYPVVISKFIQDAKEIEVDAVAKDGEVVVFAISEHVENAGIHSGDATIIHPPQDLTKKTMRGVERIARQVAKALKINGPFNIQFIAKDDKLKVIECNVRVSRSFPFVSKTMGVDLIAIATQVMIGMTPVIPTERRSVIGVKVPQFSFSRLAGADPTLGVDMISTGEVACFGLSKEEAYMKSLQATTFVLPDKNILLSIGSYGAKAEFAESARALAAMGYTLYGSAGTADYYSSQENLKIVALDWDDSNEVIEEQMAEGNFDLVINLPMRTTGKRRRPALGMQTVGSVTRRGAVNHRVPLITDIKCAKLFVRGLQLFGKDPVVGPIDCTTSQETIRIPPFVATGIRLDDIELGTKCALAGGFTTAVAIFSSTSKAIRSQTISDSLIDIGVILEDSVRRASEHETSPRRKKTTSLSEPAGSGGAGNEIVPVAFSPPTDTATVTSGGRIDIPTSMSRLPTDELICVNASTFHLASVLLFSHLYDRPVHVLDVKTVDEIQLIRKAKSKGIIVTCSVSVASLFLGAGVTSGPVKGSGSDDASAPTVSQLWDYVKDIDILTIGSGQAAATNNELQLAVPLLFGAVAAKQLTVKDINRWLHYNPHKIFNLPSFDEANTYIEIDVEYEHPANSPLKSVPGTEGVPMRGRVTRVMMRGELVFIDGEVFTHPGNGVVLSPDHKGTAVEDTVLEVVPSPQRAQPLRETHSDSPLSIEVESNVGSKFRKMGGALRGKHVLAVEQFNRDMLYGLFYIASQMKITPKPDLLKGCVLASVFYEPSTRTSCSFSSAMQRLGGSVIPIHEINTSSVAKGESLSDFIRTMECYSDIIVLRHPDKGSVNAASEASQATPVINAGDGTGEHPTQALLDVFTIREELGTVNGLTITMLGDLKHGRTVHSLARLLSLYNVTLNYVAPDELQMPDAIFDDLAKRGVKQAKHREIREVIADTDVLYVTRLQKERFGAETDASAIASYRVDANLMTHAKQHMRIMHPLPRVDEISSEVDTDPRAAYFRQMEYGVYVRMALLALVMGKC